MANPQISYQQTKLDKSIKKGIIRPDEDGYYKIILGAVNTTNTSNHFYPLRPIQRLFEANSILMRRIKSGYLKAEVGHPERSPGMTDKEYLQRVLKIDEDNVCAHIKKVTLDYEAAKGISELNNDAVVIIGDVKPNGIKASILQDDIDDPNINVAFSVRSLTMDTVQRGVVIKHFTNIVCWDKVIEPGLAVANKFDSPSCESNDNHEDSSMSIPKSLIVELIDECSNGNEETSSILESLIMTKNTGTSVYYRW